MFAVVVLLVLCSVARGGAVRYSCSESSNETLVLSPSEDGVHGRYTMTSCIFNNPNITEWKVDLDYFLNTTKCSRGRHVRKIHSTTKHESLMDRLNCTHVCFSMDFDLIFTSCYVVQIDYSKRKGPPIDKKFEIKNNLTKDIYESNTAHVNLVNHEDLVSMEWILGFPVTNDFEVFISGTQENATEESLRIVHKDFTDSCEVTGIDKVSCEVAVPLGCYHAILQHNSIWYPAFNSQSVVNHYFCRTALQTPVVAAGGGRGAALWWVSGAALLAAAALGAALLARHAMRTRNYHKAVLESWKRARECEAPHTVAVQARKVLLLYARDGPRGDHAVEKLKELIMQVTGEQVLDLYSSEVTSASAAAPCAWLRGVMAARTKVLLLQTPAAAALYATHVHQTSLNLQEPLLGRRAMYRVPHCGDQLLSLALRLVAETMDQPHDYNKYYVATYSSLETDIIQQVVPFKRYVLPGAVTSLLRDLSGAADAEPDSGALELYHNAVDEFVTHVNDNPNYLIDELIIM